MKIKGNVCIELKNVKTGEIERIKGHNFMTDFAVEELNNAGGLDFDKCGVDDMFGGIACFDSAINENTDKYGLHNHPLFPPARLNMTANSSIVANAASYSTKTVGSYNSSDSVENNGRSRRYVYDWDTQEGNGTIGCVCLTTPAGGMFGYGASNGFVTSSGMYTNNPDYLYNGNGGQNLWGTYKQSVSLSSYPPNIANRVAYIDSTHNKVGIFYQLSDLDSANGKLIIRECNLPVTQINPFQCFMANTSVETNLEDDYWATVDYVERTFDIPTVEMTPQLNSKFPWNFCLGSQYGYWYLVRYLRIDSTHRRFYVSLFNNNGTRDDYSFLVEVSDSPFLGLHGGLVKIGNYLIIGASISDSSWSSSRIFVGNIISGEGIYYNSVNSKDYGGNIFYEYEDVVYFPYDCIKVTNDTATKYARNRMYNTTDTGRIHKDLYDPYILYREVFRIGNYMSKDDINFQRIALPASRLSTIYNLPSPVNKTANKTMKIIYTISMVS